MRELGQVVQLFNPDHSDEQSFQPGVIDSLLLRLARQMYSNYCQQYPNREQPIGVIVDRHSYRCQVILGRHKPILLPCEAFIGVDQLEDDSLVA